MTATDSVQLSERSVVGGRLNKAASLLSTILRFAYTLGFLDSSCAIFSQMDSLEVTVGGSSTES